jgi:hypothetical protein
MGKPENIGRGKFILSEYIWQVLIAPLLATLLFLVFTCFFGYDRNLIWTNAIILGLWGLLIVLAFNIRRNGEIWRDYRWIIAPAVLILLFLFDVSWAQSTLSNYALEKSTIEYISLDKDTTLHLEHPSQIFYDSINDAKINLWVTGNFDCLKQKTVRLSSSNSLLLFAIQTQPDTPLRIEK